ncbi:SDR family oxidoreductase [Streptomyces sp. LP05-1]|uniref:SDR family oxidoreductase n=1 Tax=Streptomyces pyxinae TaxID=2970734 RepID=A0ABT2CEF8_9ACTN|nr:SDR family oxidoreductase [Streptomyces sp. LP05-1]MCS0635808.1 SDR family oxidoreductase [Streptomyces sp. LP05-1]
MSASPSEAGPGGGRKVVRGTGASSGIGAAVATRPAGEGHQVVAGARRTDRLRELAERTAGAAGRSGGGVEPVRLDVIDPAGVRAFVDGARERYGRVDVLVANAGVMPLSRLGSLLVDEWDLMIDVNVRGLLYAVAAVLPYFRARGSGHFVTVASIGAHQVVPTRAVYPGTKYAAWARPEGLRQEADPSVRVTTVSPGVVTSEPADTLTEPGARAAMRAYRAHAIEPDAVAAAASHALSQPADVDVNEIVVRSSPQR